MSELGSSLSWLLPLLRFASPTLPVGAFAYSRGLEYAVHAGWITDERSASEWIVGLLEHLGSQLDGPLFVRLYAALAAGDRERLEQWNDFALASRESAELRLEDTQLGAALIRLLAAQGQGAGAVSDRTPVGGELDARRFAGRDDVTYGAAFALAMLQSAVPLPAALHAYLWALTEAQVSAAVRLVPLGQTAGQRILARVVECVPAQAARALEIDDDAIGAFAPALALGSALHETQYTRLFRS